MPLQDGELARRAWNLMGGCIDWQALPVVVEIYGIEDIEIFIAQLATIRDWKQAQSDEDA